MLKLVACLAIAFAVGGLAYADSSGSKASPAARTIRVSGRKAVTVTTAQVRLGDLAAVSSSSMSDDEGVIGLQKVMIGDAPEPGQTQTFSAAQVLERLREEGINLAQIGYTFPRVMSVTRAARRLGYQEVKEAIEETLRASRLDASVREVDYRENIKVSPGDVELEVSPLESRRGGQQNFNVRVRSAGMREMAFRVKAQVDEWREVPVAARPINKGNVISTHDVKMARLNLGAIPDDVAVDTQMIVGHEADHSISDGEVFRVSRLALPPVIESGHAVTIVYRSALLEVSAAGTALEAGAQGQQIKVKNNASKAVLLGTVIEPGLVGVN